MKRTEAKPVPFPTPTRKRLAREIRGGLVFHYPFAKPETRIGDCGPKVTADVREFVDADPQLATLGYPTEHNYSVVSLTPAGEQWLASATGGERPGSTSPEPGPRTEGITPEFAAAVEEFMDENDEALGRLADGRSPEPGTRGEYPPIMCCEGMERGEEYGPAPHSADCAAASPEPGPAAPAEEVSCRCTDALADATCRTHGVLAFLSGLEGFAGPATKDGSE